MRRLCELNFIERVVNVACTTIVHGAWERVHNGLLHDLGMCTAGSEELDE